MLTRRDKVLVFLTAVTVTYIIMSNQEAANRLYEGICNGARTVKEKLTPH